jgi:NitT/TauT family transport system ATP-binding protein
MLTIEGLSLGFGGTPILDCVDLRVDSGQIVSLVGPSGSGKSTILRAVMGLHPVLSGSIALGVPRDQVGMLFQDDALLPWRSAQENVALGLRARGVAAGERIRQANDWLHRMNLAGLESRYPGRLSGGQRKRVALAQVMVLEPKFILMDEPFGALDAIVRHRITQDLLTLVESRGITVLLVTHDLEEALALSDAVYLLSAGPRARIAAHHVVDLPRPRDLSAVHADPRFGPMVARLWADLSVAAA